MRAQIPLGGCFSHRLLLVLPYHSPDPRRAVPPPLVCATHSERKRHAVARILRKQQSRLFTKAILIWKLVIIAENLVGQQVQAAAAAVASASNAASVHSRGGAGEAELAAQQQQQHVVLRSLAARMTVHVEAAFRLLGAFGFLPKYVAGAWLLFVAPLPGCDPPSITAAALLLPLTHAPPLPLLGCRATLDPCRSVVSELRALQSLIVGLSVDTGLGNTGGVHPASPARSPGGRSSGPSFGSPTLRGLGGGTSPSRHRVRSPSGTNRSFAHASPAMNGGEPLHSADLSLSHVSTSGTEFDPPSHARGVPPLDAYRSAPVPAAARSAVPMHGGGANGAGYDYSGEGVFARPAPRPRFR